MKPLTSPRPFFEAAVAAFPYGHRTMAEAAARELAIFVDDGYRQSSTEIDISGNRIYVPKRLHFLLPGENSDISGGLSPAAQCLLTRSTDGYLRQKAVRAILNLREPWVAPFVALLIGEYVVEIVEDIQASLPALDEAIYSNFVRENRSLMRLIRARAMSYWSAYYSGKYPERAAYPSLVALRQLDEWAA